MSLPKAQCDVSTIRTLLRHAVTKEAVHTLNDIVAEALYKRKDVLDRVLLEEDPQNPKTLHKGERVMITHNLSNIPGIVNGKIGSVSDISSSVTFVELNGGPLIPVPVLSSEEGLCAPLIRSHALDNRQIHGCDDSTRHFVLRGEYVCAWLRPRGDDQGQESD